MTVHLPAIGAGQTVDVAFHPPGWTAEVAAWLLAVVLGAAWSVVAAVGRSRRTR